MPLQFGKESIVDLLVGVGDALGIFERCALGGIEQLAVAPSQQLRDLGQAILGFRQTDGIDVNSKRAPVDGRHAQIDERQHSLGQPARLRNRLTELLSRLENRRAMRHHFGRIEHVAEHLALFVEDRLQRRIAAIIGNFTHSGHRNSSIGPRIS
ncbi:MAG: hypothetical protein JSR91_24575 [Proteobacteria bacterium]|nr:hypothetical protein [Pseudomonadota bacterium]